MPRTGKKIVKNAIPSFDDTHKECHSFRHKAAPQQCAEGVGRPEDDAAAAAAVKNPLQPLSTICFIAALLRIMDVRGF
jgi:hypothetical protein